MSDEAKCPFQAGAHKHTIAGVQTTANCWPADFGHYDPFFIRMAWHSAVTYRIADGLGGAGAGAQGFAPQKNRDVKQPTELARVLQKLEVIQKDCNSVQSGGKKISLADLIVLGGCAAVEAAARKAGYDVTVPFSSGRMDASQEQTDVASFAVLEPTADGLRNYVKTGYEAGAAEMLIEEVQLMRLSAPEMTVFMGGMRALHANVAQTAHGVLTGRPRR